MLADIAPSVSPLDRGDARAADALRDTDGMAGPGADLVEVTSDQDVEAARPAAQELAVGAGR
jgi:hypothetical protein